MTHASLVRTLDNKKAIQTLDRSNSFKDELSFPANLRKAVKNVKSFKLPNRVRLAKHVVIEYSKDVNNVVFAGMGGSAIAGDLIRDWLEADAGVPMESVRGYHLPAFVSENTLVFLISYSGNTEETLSCLFDALNRGCRIISISSGGSLGRVCKALGLPVIGLPKMAAARVSFPYLFAPIPYVLSRFGLVPLSKVEKDVAEATKIVDKLSRDYGIESSFENNFSKQVAMRIFGTVPIIYCYGPYRSVGLRFKTQVNENCKLPARFDFFPELNHNEIMGWEASKSILKHYTLVLLRSQDEPAEVQTRIEALKKRFFKEKAKNMLEIWPKGDGLLARMLYQLFTADMISLYLSVLHRRDPVASETFQILKYEVTERLKTLEKSELRIMGSFKASTSASRTSVQ